MADGTSQTTGTEESARADASNTPQLQEQSQQPVSPSPQMPAKPAPSPDIARILQEVKLPERRVPASEARPIAHPLADVPNVPAVPQPVQQPETHGMPAAPNPPDPEKQEYSMGEQEVSGLSPVVSLHTMKTDLQDVVREQKISLVRAASMEEDRRSARRPPALVTMPAAGFGGRNTALMIAASIVLLGLAAAAIFAVYYVMHAQNAGLAPASPALLFAEKRLTLPISDRSPGALKQTLAGMLAAAPGSVGSITQIVPETVVVDPQTLQQSGRPATLSEFFQHIGAHPPDDLMRALSGDFFFGIHAADVPSPLFVIPVLSYDRAFAGMLAWEATIDTDLSPLFKQIPAVAASDQGLPVQRQFVDLVVRNYDARALKDDAGAVVLYYSFPTPNLLIIAASPYTFPEVLSRLQAERKL